jgi:PAS domain S-box-containing protein
MCDNLKYSEDEFLRMKIWDIIPQQYMSLHKDRLAAIIKGGNKNEPAEYEVKGKDGITHIIEVLSAPYYKNNEIIGFQGIARDITERKNIDAKLKSSEERFKIFFDNAPDSLYILDLKGNFIDGNNAAEKLMGHTKNELIGKSFLKLKILSANQLLKATKLLGKNLLGQTTGPDEFVLNLKNGLKVPVEISSHPVKIKDKTFILGIARDISERKKIEEVIHESEEKYKTVVENANESILIAQDGYLKFANTKTEEMIGFSKEELSSKQFIDFVYPDDKLLVGTNYQKRIKGEETPDLYYFRILTKDGKLRWVEINAVLIDWQGKPATLNFLTDVTVRKLAEEALLKSEEKFRSYIENSPIGIFIVDETGHYQDCNRSTEIMTGYTREELLNLSIPELLPLQDFENGLQNFQKLLETGSNKFEINLLRKDKTLVPVILDSVKMPENNMFIAYCTDITVRKKADQELIIAKEHAEESDKLKTAFLQNMSHEIRTPLNGIIGFSDLLNQGNLDQDEIREFTHIISQSGKRLLEIVNNVLDISKIQTGQIKIKQKSFLINSLFSDLLTFFSPLAASKNVILN